MHTTRILSVVMPFLVPSVRLLQAASVPSLALMPDSVVAGTGGPVSVSGSGLRPNKLVTLRLDGVTVLGYATSDGGGAFSTPVPVGRVAIGQHLLQATATLTVTGQPASVTVSPNPAILK